jgi:multidrug efflux pump subunit AcrA (membrane-fusion protein)
MNQSSKYLVSLIVLLVFSITGCDGHDHSMEGHDHQDSHAEHDDHSGHSDAEDHHGHEESELPAAVITHFNDYTELFVEFPILSVGNESPFAAHLTWLDTFKPVAEGSVRVVLRGGGAPEEEFSVYKPSIPGIFRPVAIPKYAGEREVIVILENEKQASIHNLGSMWVFPYVDDIPTAVEEEDDGSISYLKEQQWQVDFATAPVLERTLKESVPAVAYIKPNASAEAEVSAPHDGQLAKRGKSFPTIGMQVSKGQVLAIIGTPIGRELSTLNNGDISGTALRAPISGVIAHAHTTVGSYLEKGQPVFHIIDPKKLWLENQIPEADLLRISESDGAWFSVPNREEPFEIITSGESANGRIVAYGQINPRTRTAPFTIEFSNPDGLLRPGMLVESRVLTGKTIEAAAIPVSSIVRDNGVPVVYVELGGESFERRVIQTGVRDGNFIEVTSGVNAGERVVSRGAYLVKLAATSPAEAGHGHAH